MEENSNFPCLFPIQVILKSDNQEINKIIKTIIESEFKKEEIIEFLPSDKLYLAEKIFYINILLQVGNEDMLKNLYFKLNECVFIIDLI